MIVALAGGVGGAKLAAGLAQRLGRDLAVIVNTGDDFEHLGLHISPDLDTVMYTLAGIANPDTGWGIAGETWAFLEQVAALGGPGWFRLGDRDLAVHVLRTAALRAGQSLSAVTADLCRSLDVIAKVMPMSDQALRTIVHTREGALPFQEYFVARKCDVPVTGFSFDGIDRASPSEAVRTVFREAGVEAVVLCPSNPFVSIAPILSVPGMRRLILAAGAPVVAVSPIIGGAAVKGPAAKMMRELGVEPTAAAVAERYRGLVNGFVMDADDRALGPAVEAMGMRVKLAAALMKSAADRVRLADDCITFARELRQRRLA
jgi:LPPG:FO 2-phospho-L-lactate transferase